MRGTTHAVLVPRPELAVRGDARNRSISFSDNSGNDLWVELPVVKGDAVLRSKILQVESVEPDTTFQAEPAGYDDWKQGAVLGAKFALAAVKGPKLSSRRRNHRSNDWYQPVHCGSRMRPRRVECARGHSPRSCTSESQCHGPQQLQAPLRCITLL